MSRLRFHCPACHRIDLRVPTRADEEIECSCGQQSHAELVEEETDEKDEPPVALAVELPPPVVSYENPVMVDGEAIDPHFPDAWGDLYLPLVLIAVAAVFGFFGCVFLHIRTDRLDRLFFVFVIVKLTSFWLGYLLMSNFSDVRFGTPHATVLKFVAIAMLPDVTALWAVVLLGPCPGALLAIPVGIGTALLLLMRLFDMDFVEARAFSIVVGLLLFLSTVFAFQFAQ